MLRMSNMPSLNDVLVVLQRQRPITPLVAHRDSLGMDATVPTARIATCPVMMADPPCPMTETTSCPSDQATIDRCDAC